MRLQSRLSRALALFLSVQPVLWMGNVALAQTLQPPLGLQPATPGGGSDDTPVPVAPTDPEVVRAERAVLTRDEPAMPALDEPVDADRYVCGTGDVLELNFWGLQNFRLRVPIDMEGRAFVPKVGFFALGGKTLTDARTAMRASVARYFPRLNFDVTLAEPRTFRVQVAENVVKPGSYQARAIDRVATIVSRAGGLSASGSKRRVEVRRRDGTVLRADLLLYALTGDVRHNPFLLDGDVIRVPVEDLVATVAGAVNRPGSYELVGTRDLAELLDLGAGLAPNATRKLPISVVSRSAEDRQAQHLLQFGPAGEMPATQLKHDDVVRIPSAGELQQSVVLVGALSGVNSPEEANATRRVPFVQGDSVRTLLERTGGVGPSADMSGAYVLRNGKPLPVNLYDLVMLRQFQADRTLELGDTLVVPFKRRSILVQGAVFAPGPYPYNPTYSIEQYLALAGGRNRFAQPLGDVRLITPDGQTKEFTPDLHVDPGSSLVVPERNFSRSELVQIGLGVAGILISGVAVVLAAKR